MELHIQGRNVEINDQVRNHVQQKLGQLGRHLPGLSRVTVELASESTRAQSDRVVAQVTLAVSGSVLRAEQRGSSTKTAINSVAEVLARRIERYKSRAYHSERAKKTPPLRSQEAEAVAQGPDPLESEGLAGGDLVKIKRFNMKPMTVEEAAFQMQLLGHRFFMFLDSESDRYNVLYLRDDGNFGLIQPSEGL